MSSAAPPADAAARFAAVLPLAQAWFDDDPDEHTRAELADLLTHAESGDTAALLDLEDRFVGPLEFGTAGLRGRLGAGPNRMNRSVVIRAAAGLTAYLQHDASPRVESPFVVIGYDSWHGSLYVAPYTLPAALASSG